ncbi:MAG: lasso peptide biosynthesis B2 protein [Cyanobacteriota bacterium]|nr:lasso peptide biosynthesis B2 protein [Cyanobacteriota bacterium]
MKAAVRGLRRLAGYGLFALLDHLVWIAIVALPGRRLLDLARSRPWRGLALRLSPAGQRLWADRIAWLLRTRCRRARWGSTCLSRSLSGRVLLDGIGVANELHLGMSKGDDGRKVPHAWLRDPASGRLWTPGLTPGAGAPLTRF